MSNPTYYTLKTAAEEFANMPDDILPGWISSQSTILYGMSGVGKGRLIAELCATGLNGEPFAGVNWTKPLERIAVLATDAGGPREYAKRLGTAGVGIEHEEDVRIYPLATGASAQEWAELTSAVLAWRPSLIIIDSTTEAVAGSVSEDVAVKALWKCLAPFHVMRTSIPLILVHHVPKPSFDNGAIRGQTPIGSGVWEALSRNKILLRPGFRNDHSDVSAECRPRFAAPFTAHFVNTDDGRLIHATTDTAEDLAAAKSQNRAATLAVNREVAQWAAANCDGMTKKAGSALIAEHFPLVSSTANDRVSAIEKCLAGPDRMKRRDFGVLLTITGLQWSMA